MSREEEDSSCCSVFCCCCCCCCCCCPRKIPEAFIFMPPSPPYYELDVINATSGDYAFRLSPKADTKGLRNVIRQEARLIKTNLDNNIAVLYFKCTPTKRFTILYSHGNAADLGMIHRRCVGLSLDLGCDFVAYDYSGYGQSDGNATEENLYADIQAAWDYIITFHEPKAEKIILFGASLGTAAAIDLASKIQCAGVILQSPFTSMLRVVCPHRRPRRRLRCIDTFKSIEKVPKVTSPVLVIHGTNDEIIDFSHGQAIYERCPRAVEPLWVEGAGHNDIELYGQYVERLRKFINEELSN